MALSIRPDSRQIPCSPEYTSNKLYNDLMYGYLQSISLPTESGERYVRTVDVSYVKLASALGINRITAKTYLEGLQKLLLVSEKENGKYRLFLIAQEYATLVPNDVLKVLVEKKHHRLISFYAILLNLSAIYPYRIEYNYTTMKDYLGVSVNSGSNSYIIIDIVNDLVDLKLMKHDQYNKPNENNSSGFSTVNCITGLTNILA